MDIGDILEFTPEAKGNYWGNVTNSIFVLQDLAYGMAVVSHLQDYNKQPNKYAVYASPEDEVNHYQMYRIPLGDLKVFGQSLQPIF